LKSKRNKPSEVQMQKVCWIFLLALLAGCQSGRALRPKSSAGAPKIELVPSGGIYTHRLDSLNLARLEGEIMGIKKALKRPADSLTVYLSIVKETDCPALEAENAKLRKQKKTLEKIAGLVFLLATGHLIYQASTP
jgi:hypothetical protein